jgi:aryl-alcohol dehydrogenase-like predicted oxidoreductase
MQYALLGKTGLRISKAFLGAMTFGQDRTVGAPRDECRRMPDGTPMPAAT